MASGIGQITLSPAAAGGANDRVKYAQAAEAYTAIDAGSLCGFTDNGLEQLGAGVAFDTSKPVLYSASAVAAGAEANDLYIFHSAADARTITGDSTLTLEAGSAVYIRGTLNGNTLTLPAAGTDWLVYEPDSADYIYMGIGRAAEGTGVHTLAFVNDSQLYVCDYDGSDYTLTKIEEWVKVLSQDSAQTIANIDTVVMKYNGETSVLSSWMVFSGSNYLEIGSSTSGEANPQKVRITPNRISFLHGANEVAYMTPEGFYFTKGIVNTSLKIGNYLLRDDGDGGFAIV